MFRKVDMSPPEQDAYEAGARDMRERAAAVADLHRGGSAVVRDSIRALPLRAEERP